MTFGNLQSDPAQRVAFLKSQIWRRDFVNPRRWPLDPCLVGFVISGDKVSGLTSGFDWGGTR